MGLCGRPGAPMPGNKSGRRQPGNSAVPSTVGRLGVDGFWMRDYGGGGPGKPPCWRTLKESCKGLGSVSLKINNQHTHTHRRGRGSTGGRDIILSQKGFNMKKESTELKTLQLGDRNPLLMFFSSLFSDRPGCGVGLKILRISSDLVAAPKKTWVLASDPRTTRDRPCRNGVEKCPSRARRCTVRWRRRAG